MTERDDETQPNKTCCFINFAKLSGNNRYQNLGEAFLTVLNIKDNTISCFQVMASMNHTTDHLSYLALIPESSRLRLCDPLLINGRAFIDN